jgi:multidrug efflux pump subunit AcrB
MVITEGAQDASFETMASHQRAVAQILLKNPYVEAFSSSVGASGISSTSNSGVVLSASNRGGSDPRRKK